MTPLSCSLVVRALASPALMTPLPAPYSTSICGSCVSSRPPFFLLSAGIAILVLVTAHETKPARYSSLGSSPIGALYICSGCCLGGRHFALFFGCHALHKPSPHGVGCSCALAYVSFVFRVLASYCCGPTLALQSLMLSTWRKHPGPTFVQEPPLRLTYSINS